MVSAQKQDGLAVFLDHENSFDVGLAVANGLNADEDDGQWVYKQPDNPPYGKSWASEQKYIKDGSDVIDPRFKVSLKDYWGNLEVVDATPRSVMASCFS